VREEGRTIVIGSGVFPQWIDSGRTISFGPTLVPAGQLTVAMRGHGDGVVLDVDLDSRAADLDVRVAIPGYRQRQVGDGDRRLEVKRL
jgi:hypothetical protein